MKRPVLSLVLCLALALLCAPLERRSAHAARLVTVRYEVVSATNRIVILNGSCQMTVDPTCGENDVMEIQGSGTGGVVLARLEDGQEVDRKCCTAENVSANTVAFQWLETFD